MPEFNEAEQGRTSRQGSGNRSSMTINKELQANRNRVGSAKYYDVASALLGKGKADLEELFLNAARDGDFDQIENFLLRRSDVIVSIDVKDKRTGNTALIWAAKRGHTKIVQLLLRHGADITLRNYESQTAVEVASPAIKTVLLDSVERTTESSHRLLLQAAWQGNIKILRKLLTENKVKDINCQNADGLTALLLVCRDIQLFERLSTQLNRPYNPVEVVEELLNNRANIHALDSDDKSCLHYAVQSKASLAQSVVQSILSAGPDLNAQDKRLFAPIHCASQTGNVDCLEVLLEGGSNVNHRGFNGATPLHITAYNDHEKAASCLLRHGADILLVDDTGLTAVDLARGRKMKATLKEAWTEATQCRQSTNLGPLKTPGREDSRVGGEETKRRKGEVIFDALPANPFVSSKNATNRGKPVTRTLSLKEKATKAEENMMKEIENGDFKPSAYFNTKKSECEHKSRSCSPCRDGVRRLGLVRGRRASPTPLPKVNSKERLPAISPSPDRTGFDRNTDSPAFSRTSRFRRSLEEGKLMHKNGKPATYPAPGGRPNRVSPLTIRDNTRTSPLTVRDNNRVSPITVRDNTRLSPLTVLDDADVDQCMHINRFQPPSPTPGGGRPQRSHRRVGSDSVTTNTGEILASCGSILKGRSTSLSHSEDYTDHYNEARYPQREATHYFPLSRETNQKNLYNHSGHCVTKTTSEVILDLDRMGLTNKCPQTPVQGVQLYPTSSKVLPPTPTFTNQELDTHHEPKTVEDKVEDNSSKEPSPRSDEDDVINDKEVKMAFSGTIQLLRSGSMYKDEFVLEESRPRDLSLRSSSSEESHQSKASEASTSSGEVFVFEKDPKTHGDKFTGANKVQSMKKGTSGKQKTQQTIMESSDSKTTMDRSNTGFRPSAVVMACVPKQNQILNNISAASVKSEENKKKGGGGGLTSKSAGNAKGKITLHSQIPDENGNGSKSTGNDKGAFKVSSGAQKSQSAKNSGVNSAGAKGPMQVVSSKLLSNVKEEIKKAKELVDSSNEGDGKKPEPENGDDDKEKAKLMAARQKLTKSESSMADIKQEESKNETSDRPKTQASANINLKSDASGQTKVVDGRNKIIVAPANQSNRNTTSVANQNAKNMNGLTNKNSGSPAVSANQTSRNNQGNKNSVPSYLQPTKSSVGRDASPNTARKTPASSRNSSGAVTIRNSSGVGNSRNFQNSANTKSSAATQNPPSATSRHTTFTGINKANNCEPKQGKNLTNVSTADPAQASVSSKAETVSVPTQNNSSAPASGSNIVRSAKSVKVVTPSTGSKPVTSANAVNRTGVNSASSVSTSSKPTSSTANAKGVKGGTNTPKVNPTPQASSGGKNSGIRKSPSDSNVSRQNDTAAQKDSSTSVTQSETVNVGVVNKPNQQSLEIRPEVEVQSSSNTGNAKPQNFPYKPANGKPPLVEIVTAESPRIPKSKCVDSEVVIPVQTPLIVNPFENFEHYKETPAVSKQSEKKGNSKGVSATSFGFVVSKPQMERSKTNVSVKSQGKGGKKGRDGKPSSANAKLGGGRRKGAKSKESKGSDEGAVPRPKSGKRRARSGKRRKKTPAETQLSKQAAQSDVALISGIGWHLATKCIDTSDVIAVKTRTSHSSGSSVDSEDDLDNPTPRPERMLTEEELQLLTSQDFQFPLNIDIDTPRPGPSELKLQMPSPSSAKYLQINNQDLMDLSSANLPTPRFKQVKLTDNVEHLPRMEYDGYRPMNLDMSQTTLPADLESTQVLHCKNLNNSLPAGLGGVYLRADDVEVFSNPDVDEATAELHRQLLMHKLTPIPESPSLKSTLPIHKTIEALQNFDREVQDETLDNLLGLRPGEMPDSSRTDLDKNVPALGAKNLTASQKQDVKRRSTENIAKSANNEPSSKKDKEKSLKESTSPNPRRKSFPSKSDRPLDSKEAVRLSIENIRAAIEKSKKANEGKAKGGMKKSASDSKLAQSKMNVNSVPKLDLTHVENVIPDNAESSQRTRGGHSTRRERKFSETKSEEREEAEDENLDEAIEDIMSNTFNSTSTLRSNKSLKSGRRSHTLTDADRHLIMKMAENNESPFHAKQNVSASACETSRKRHYSDSYDESTAQHSTNPNLLKVFHAGDFKLGQKVKAMMDAGADKEKIKIMINVDNEARQLAKIMNSFRNMELYAGPGGSCKMKRPEVSHGEPVTSSKPPFVRPGSGGPIGKVRSAGRFTEIRGSKAEEGISIRNSGQRDVRSQNISLQQQVSQNNSGFPVGDMEEELVNALCAGSPDNTTIVSEMTEQYDSMSRSTSACTSISSQSNIDDTIQWKKGNILGKGAFGTVWCGLTSEGQLIAVKQIELNTNDKDKAKREYEKVQEEVELLKTLNHKNIVGYLGTSLEEEDGLVSIFMQFVPGGSIASILARFGALDEAVFRRYTRQILEGVQYLHENDVIHRDIKGGNVMLMPNGIIKLIDFGCAKRLCINLSMSQSQILKSMKGTPYWMAPEVVNESGHGKKSDIWSIGCTIFEMATRKPPWSDMNPMAAIFAIGSDRPVPQLPSKFTQEAIDFVNACLTRDQSKRPAATQLLQHNFILKRRNSKK